MVIWVVTKSITMIPKDIFRFGLHAVSFLFLAHNIKLGWHHNIPLVGIDAKLCPHTTSRSHTQVLILAHVQFLQNIGSQQAPFRAMSNKNKMIHFFLFIKNF
jgi:hypothetical protein